MKLKKDKILAFSYNIKNFDYYKVINLKNDKIYLSTKL